VRTIIDTHNHCCEFSADSSQPLKERLEEAQRLGLRGLVMTDHFDKWEDLDIASSEFHVLDIYPEDGEWVFNIPDYIERIRVAQENLAKAHSSLELYKGIELGYRPYLVPAFLEVSTFYKDDLDLLIGSVHNLSPFGYPKLRKLYAKGKKEAYTLYLEALMKMVEDMPFMNVLGHFDYISRYNTYDDKKLRYEDFADHLDRLFKLIIERDIALEINTATQLVKNPSGQPIGLTDEAILRRYKDLGGTLICLASDAHHEGRVGQMFEQNKAQLENLGFDKLCHFEKGQIAY
jgi:histidinol-phosphatase (PHP family)